MSVATGVSVLALVLSLVGVHGLVLSHGDNILGDGHNLLDDENLDDLVVANGLVESGRNLLVVIKSKWGSDWSWSWSWLLLLLSKDTSVNLWRLNNWSWLDLGDLGGGGWGGGLLGWLNLNWLVHGLSILWTLRVWRVAWKLLEWASVLTVLGESTGLDEALLGSGTWLDVKDWAILDAAGHVGAGVDGGLEDRRVPPGDEISVVSVTSGVTVGPDELTSHSLESSGVPDGLEHESWEADWELRWARASHDTVWVGDVSLVGWSSGESLSVPAGWEHELGTDSVLAVCIEELLGWHLVAGEGVLWLDTWSVVHAVEADGLGLEGVGLMAKLGLTSDHGETFRISGDLTLLAWRVVEEVISAGLLAAERDVRCSQPFKSAKINVVEYLTGYYLRKHSTDLVNQGVLSIGSALEVEWWSPVGGLVLGNSAGGAVGVHQLRRGGNFGEACRIKC